MQHTATFAGRVVSGSLASTSSTATESSSQVLRRPVFTRRLVSKARICRCAAGQGTPEGELLAAEFSKFVNEAGVQAPTLQGRSPTHLMPPTAVIAAQLDALQCNDWPETDAGIRTAFQFSKPYEAEKLLRGQSQSGLVHSWQGVEPWVNFESFAAALNSAPFRILLGCERWQPISQLLFPSSRYGNKAVQAVEVIAKAEEPAASRQASTKQQRRYTFTFCLERVDEGSYKGCWMTVGLRVGDYASV